jgi:hypothetical protein
MAAKKREMRYSRALSEHPPHGTNLHAESNYIISQCDSFKGSPAPWG